ncbi:hypothetical protein Rhopal_006952-T1 [Rhodotorula paludigena]|uniref:RRM domain-containing protein n=1 Tax=Rhodotorula paludigena TaxID=86838 RepID=A0AAV5GZH3_9BASI|nr:hypothetical protein Rhopal_006952-T1 [Rhodotorula paludigena]
MAPEEEVAAQASAAAPAGTTRLLLTGLHPSVAAHHLRQHILACPPTAPAITDLKVLSRASGASRCIAFAGFKTHGDADRVRQWTSGAWVAGDKGGTRINVDWAKESRDAPPPHKRVRVSTAASTAATGRDDRFADFLAVMAPSRRLDTVVTDNASLVASAKPFSAAPLESSAAIEANAHAATAARATPPSPQRKAQPAAQDGAALDETLSDADYLARRMKRKLADDEVEDDDALSASGSAAWAQDDAAASEPSSGIDEIQPSGAASQSADEATDADILLTGRLFLRNLPFDTTEAELSDVFGAHGHIEQVHLPRDAATGQSKGLAFVTFRRPADAVAARKALDGTTFQGRLLHILAAGSGQTFTWSALYLNADAALASVADRLGVAKSALLDPSSSDPAVKVALAEAHTLAETKRYFEEHHVNVAAFSRPGARSASTILVKNLPFGTTSASVQALFAPHGVVKRLLLPPSGLIAIVEMEDALGAAAAWRALAYKQFGSSVLYLEKAPAAIWSSDKVERPATQPHPSQPAAPAQTRPGSTIDESDDPSVAGATLFVKNLNFATTTPRLQAAFESVPEFAFARVQTKPDPARPGQTLSMGFGFVGFRTVEAAKSARTARQGFVLDGHALDLRFAQRNADQVDASGSRNKASFTSTKLLVKNVPFEATRADLRQLFGAYGQLKSVRLPRKMDNKTRGFAFLEFASRREAEAAFAALEHTHLLGRHLVLQWTDGDDSSAVASSTGQGTASQRGSKSKFVM